MELFNVCLILSLSAILPDHRTANGEVDCCSDRMYIGIVSLYGLRRTFYLASAVHLQYVTLRITPFRAA